MVWEYVLILSLLVMWSATLMFVYLLNKRISRLENSINEFKQSSDDSFLRILRNLKEDKN